MDIAVPDPSLVILCGPAASGKSAFARTHFAETRIVSSDRCRALLWDKEEEQAASHLVFELMHSIIDKRLFLRRLTVADSTALAPDARKELRTIAERRQVPSVLIAFEVPMEELRSRNASRDRRVPDEILAEHAEKFARALERFPHEGYAAWWTLRPGDTAKVSFTPPPAPGL